MRRNVFCYDLQRLSSFVNDSTTLSACHIDRFYATSLAFSNSH